jgi:hypothetical protein
MEKFQELDSKLGKEVDNVLNLLKAGDKGDYIKHKPYPKLYVRDGAKNLFKYNIHSYRLIYTIVGTEDSKRYEILDFLTHKEYDVLFGYHTS